MREVTINLIHGRPPNFERIAARFPEARKDGAIFTYGDTVYWTGKQELSRELRAHEGVHAVRQLATQGGPETWWERYLTEDGFRFDEELRAHRAEWAAYCKRHGQSPRFLTALAERLSGPLYGGMVTVADAKHAILTGSVFVHGSAG